MRSARFRPVFRPFFWLLVTDCVLLTFAGGRPPEGTWLMLSRLGAAYYFLHFLVILPLVSAFETPDPLPNSIRESVLHGEEAEAAPAGQTRPRRGSVATAG